MKVHYRSVCRELEEIFEHAHHNRRKIEAVDLTPTEWREFMLELTGKGLYVPFDTSESLYCGMTIRRVTESQSD